MPAHTFLLPLLLLLSATLTLASASNPPLLKPTKITTSKGLRTISFDMIITVSRGAPDCFTRDVILVNGLFQPTIEVNVNDTVRITVNNQIPSSFPQVASGVSIHWHGLYMWGAAVWYDGTAYATQCPIGQGKKFTYKFKVDEAEGSYFWHDHSTANRANGLQGAFIVRQGNPAVPTPFGKTSDDFVLVLSDWFHDEGNVMAMRLNRPIVEGKVTADSGIYEGVPAPDSLLINGRGRYDECSNSSQYARRGENNLLVPLCEPEKHPLVLGSADVTGGCSHNIFTVSPGQTYYVRLINAASASYLTVCFENHTLELIMADAVPTNINEYSCIDINSGQRYDLQLTTATDVAPGSTFWISVHSQYRSMSPSAYAVLQYADTTSSHHHRRRHRQLLSSSPSMHPPPPSPPAAVPWPISPSPQPGMKPWGPVDVMAVNTHDGVLGYLDNYDFQPFWSQFSSVGGQSYFQGILYYPANQTIVLNMSSPVIESTGRIRWAMNNVAMPVDPPCAPLMQTIMNNPLWLPQNTLNSSSLAALNTLNQAAAAHTKAEVTSSSSKNPPGVYIDGQMAPLIPVVGKHVAEVYYNEVVDVVLNNVPPADGSSTLSVQHPMHMHGHKFWVLGVGSGVYNATADGPGLNTYNPLYRDTVSLPANGWAVIRFSALNPGIWPFHCHILWHSFMGQQMYIFEAQDRWPPRPYTMPACGTKCIYNFAAFSHTYLNKTYPGAVNGSDPHQLP